MVSCTPPLRTDVLRSIADSSRELHSILGSRLPKHLNDSNNNSSKLPAPISLVLPPIPDIRNVLLGAGAPEGQARALTAVFRRHAMDLRNRLLQLWTELPYHPETPALYDKLCSVQSNMLKQRLDAWISECLTLVHSRASISSHTARVPKKERKPFNHQYTPLLEHFFMENPFPTHADKAFLAKKTGMTYHQIHVWFQNHRTRTRKGGGDLQRKPLHELPKLPLDNLIKSMGDRIVPACERTDPADPDTSECEWQLESSDEESTVSLSNFLPADTEGISNNCAPPHAFPALYPPPSNLKPFPIKDGIRDFPIPPWRRRFAQKVVEHPHIDFGEFIQAFGGLNVREYNHQQCKGMRGSSSKPKIRRSRVISPSHQPTVTSAFLTETFCVPLPSFIPNNITPPRFVHPLPVVAAPYPLYPFESPSPQSKPATLIPPPSVSVPKNAGRRKVAPLPRRRPVGTSVMHRSVTPAPSDIPSSPPSPRSIFSRDSRTPSLASNSSQTSSETGFSSNEAVTPISPISSLPATSQSSVPDAPSSSPSGFTLNITSIPYPSDSFSEAQHTDAFLFKKQRQSYGPNIAHPYDFSCDMPSLSFSQS